MQYSINIRKGIFVSRWFIAEFSHLDICEIFTIQTTKKEGLAVETVHEAGQLWALPQKLNACHGYTELQEMAIEQPNLKVFVELLNRQLKRS